MSLLLQTTTRPTFWRIGPVGKALFYYLAAVALLVFGYGVYRRSRPSASGSSGNRRFP